MSNQSFYLLLAVGACLVFGLIALFQKYLSAEKEIEKLTEQLAVAEGERERLSRLVMG